MCSRAHHSLVFFLYRVGRITWCLAPISRINQICMPLRDCILWWQHSQSQRMMIDAPDKRSLFWEWENVASIKRLFTLCACVDAWASDKQDVCVCKLKNLISLLCSGRRISPYHLHLSGCLLFSIRAYLSLALARWLPLRTMSRRLSTNGGHKFF